MNVNLRDTEMMKHVKNNMIIKIMQQNEHFDLKLISTTYTLVQQNIHLFTFN